MCTAMPHADDELQSLLVVHAVLVRDLHVVVEKRDLTVSWARERFKPLPSDHELSNRFVTHPSSIVPR